MDDPLKNRVMQFVSDNAGVDINCLTLIPHFVFRLLGIHRELRKCEPLSIRALVHAAEAGQWVDDLMRG